MRVFGRDDDKDDDLIMLWPQMMGHQQAQMGGCSQHLSKGRVATLIVSAANVQYWCHQHLTTKCAMQSFHQS